MIEDDEYLRDVAMELYLKHGDRGMKYKDVKHLCIDFMGVLFYIDINTGLSIFTAKARELIRS